MKRLTAFLLVALIGWNIVLTILYLQSKEDTTAATAAQQTKQKVETASVNITSDVTELVAKSENKVVTVTAEHAVRHSTLEAVQFIRLTERRFISSPTIMLLRMGMKRLSPLRTARNRRWISSERTS